MQELQWWQAVVLGVVEGLTEYLPVSSTGHLILAQRLMGIPESEALNAYTIVIQFGAILAVVGLYFRRVKQMTLGVLGRDVVGFKLASNVVIGVIPAVIFGLALESTIKTYLFGGDKWGLWPIVLAWFVGGVAILAVSRWRRQRTRDPEAGLSIDDLTWRMALIIGFLQCIAMWPGVSRSLMTIVAGVLVGLSLPAAVEFSFLLGVVTLTGAAMKDSIDYHELIMRDLGVANVLVGIIVATLAVAVAVKWMVSYLHKHGLSIFGWYRVALGVVVAVMIVMEVV